MLEYMERSLRIAKIKGFAALLVIVLNVAGVVLWYAKLKAFGICGEMLYFSAFLELSCIVMIAAEMVSRFWGRQEITVTVLYVLYEAVIGIAIYFDCRQDLLIFLQSL